MTFLTASFSRNHIHHQKNTKTRNMQANAQKNVRPKNDQFGGLLFKNVTLDIKKTQERVTCQN